MSKEEILRAIRSCAKKLKRNPNLRDLRLLAGISELVLYRRFGSLRKALESAGLRPAGPGMGQQESTLLLDWAAVARKLRKLPSVHEYESAGRFSNMPFHTRYHRWTRVPEAFRRFAREARIEREWKHVLSMIASRNGKHSQARETALEPRQPPSRRGRVLKDRPLYGPLMNLPEMLHEPTNEQGVIFGFGLVARHLGFSVLRFQTGFPDCEALRQVERGQLQRVKIEFEFESRNFLKHRHRRDGCDAIVCWRHNWKECPLEVIEVRKVLQELLSASEDRRS